MNLTTATLNQETSVYWEQLKGASEQVKLALISMLSASLVKPVAKTATDNLNKKLHISREDLEITPFVASIGQGIKPLPADFDYDKAKQEFLATRKISGRPRFPYSSHKSL